MATTEQRAELCVGELYRDDQDQEVWRIKEIGTGNILREGIASENDYEWLLDAFNHGEHYADAREGARLERVDGQGQT